MVDIKLFEGMEVRAEAVVTFLRGALLSFRLRPTRSPYLVFLSLMRLRLVLGFVAGVLGVGVSRAEVSLAEGWRQVAEQRYAEARELFAPRAVAGGAEEREARLGLAVALLGQQPKTQGNVNLARETLTPLAEADRVDDWVLQARYFLGRIAELHEREPDLALARRHYRRLFEGHPEAAISQAAAVKYVLIALNAVETPAEKRATLAALEELSGLFTDAAARRDYHALMTSGYLRHAPDERRAARRHAQAADAAGFTDDERRRSNLLRIAELSRALGDQPTARHYYQRFLVEAQRDIRARLVEERLAELDSVRP